MTIFDLLFLVLLLATVIALLTAVVFSFRRQFRRSGRILRRLGICAAAYMAVVVILSLVLPRRVLKPDAAECFDDWCIAVAGFKRLPEGSDVAYHVDLRLSSRARRVSQRENHLSVYLTDHQDKRYDPAERDSNTPFNVLLGPQESVVVNRVFRVPSAATDVGLVIAHEGGFPIGWFIIGYDTWFRKPAAVELR